MIIGKVVGNVWATRKEESLHGLKLLIIKPIDYYSYKEEETLVAADIVGAGVGEVVLIVKGSSAGKALFNKNSPVDAAIVGIIDEVEVNKSL
jgi:ethanolamine utilization protein EutN